jgi:hypothetical protein
MAIFPYIWAATYINPVAALPQLRPTHEAGKNSARRIRV